MVNGRSLNVLLVAEGSGGHLIPALQVANALAQRGVRAKVWYAKREATAPLAQALLEDAVEYSVEVDPIPMNLRLNMLQRFWYCNALWWHTQRCFAAFDPDVVVGFGGWVSAPVVLAARQRRIAVLLHEQNVCLGRANRLLTRLVNRVAVSFEQTTSDLHGTYLRRGWLARLWRGKPVSVVLTGLPVRRAIGLWSREQAARRFGFDVARPTLLVLGGSQGAAALNDRLIRLLPDLSAEERERWQVIHLTGLRDAARVQTAYAAAGLRAFVAPFLADIAPAYAHADLAVARGGASTLAELARSGTPAILIPYPGADGHQRANVQVAVSAGGAVALDECEATPIRVLQSIRQLLEDPVLRKAMADRIRVLSVPDATSRLAEAIVNLPEAVG